MMPSPFDVLDRWSVFEKPEKWKNDKKMGLLDGCVDERGGNVARLFCGRGAGSMISLKDSFVFQHPSAR